MSTIFGMILEDERFEVFLIVLFHVIFISSLDFTD